MSACVKIAQAAAGIAVSAPKVQYYKKLFPLDQDTGKNIQRVPKSRGN